MQHSDTVLHAKAEKKKVHVSPISNAQLFVLFEYFCVLFEMWFDLKFSLNLATLVNDISFSVG